jgi:hypothetical protein
LDFNCASCPWGNFLCRGNGDKFRHGDGSSFWPSGQWNRYIPQTRQ